MSVDPTRPTALWRVECKGEDITIHTHERSARNRCAALREKGGQPTLLSLRGQWKVEVDPIIVVVT